MVSTHSIFFACAVFSATAFAASAQASPAKIRGADAYEIALEASNGRGSGVENGSTSGAERASAYVRLDGAAREILRDYYASNCPPGLAKKNNGCLPPGIANKRYKVGSRLPDGYFGDELPFDVVQRLPALPNGHVYRLLDGDLGIIELTTLIVLDAIGIY